MLAASSQIMQILLPATKSLVQQELIMPPEAFPGVHRSQPTVALIFVRRQFLVLNS